MNLLWYTRGHGWGLRFLRTGGVENPLPLYERAFARLADEREGVSTTADGIAIRFADPLARRDRSNRPIRHDVLILDPGTTDEPSLESEIELVWPSIEDEYARVFDLPDGPR